MCNGNGLFGGNSCCGIIILLIVLCVLVALLLLCAILGRVAPGLLDPLLYSKEELQILRY